MSNTPSPIPSSTSAEPEVQSYTGRENVSKDAEILGTTAVESTSDSTEHIYAIPQRCVKFPNDMVLWEKSCAYHHLLVFINSISQAVQGHRCTETMQLSDRVESILGIFDKLDQIVTDTPPIQQPQRFGNQAYRICYGKLKEDIVSIVQAALPDSLKQAGVEMSVYLVESFGNSVRIDYGTGHELSFIMFLCCLYKVEALKDADKTATGLKIFYRYLKFVRNLQMTYRMEPAGSHGVWSLDDYQFVPFIWGSAQFAVKPPIRPAQFLEPTVIEELKDDYLFVGCIDYIHKVKTGSFAEHSPQLWHVSAVESWIKINSGLLKMYQKEILAKFPVIQHVLFGSLMEFKPVAPGTTVSVPRLGMPPPNEMTKPV